MKNSVLTVFLVLLTHAVAFSQLNYANRLYEENDFETASKMYEKVFAKDSGDVEVIERLASCYKKLNKYDLAEKYYGKAVKFEKADPESYLNYGQLLKNNNKIRQARDQFYEYVKRKPESLLGKLLLQSCDDISEWASAPSEFQVENMRKVNTEYLEMGPVPFGDKLVFTSDKNYMEKESKDGKKVKSLDGNVYGIYIYDSLNRENPIRPFSTDIVTADNIEGPAYFNAAQDHIYYTKVFSRQRYSVNQMELHMAHLDNGKWVKDSPFNFNSKEHSLTNPVLSPDEKFLYFASDKPGGFGGFDIYFCERGEQGFSQPVNLGEVINTSGNEIPSYIDQDNNLYFSSNYHPGFGGLDIFKSQMDGKSWSKPENIKSPFNSSKDDLGFYLIDSLSGYFSSNRDGGMGLDDIYYFVKHKFTDSSYYTDISGLFVFDTLPMINMSLALLDENDEIVQMVVTNEKGEFSFKNVPAEGSYKILIDEAPEKVPDEAKIYLTDERYQKIMLIERLQKGLFTFETLKRDDYEGLSLMDEVDDAGRPTLTVLGQLHKKGDSAIAAGKKIFVVDDKGNVMATSIADHLGKFRFEKLSIDDQYLFKLEENDPDIDIHIISTEGKLVGRTVKNKDGFYVYHKFTINPSDNPDIRGLFKYGNLPADKVLLMLLDENDEIIQITETNIKGEFEFKKLNAGNSYRIKADSNVTIPANANLFLMDKHTGTLMPVSKLANGSFEFKTLAPMTPPELELMAEEDYIITPRTDLIGQVYNEKNTTLPSGLEVQLQDINGKTVAIAKTNDKGMFKFFNLPIEDQYLFNIPENDPDFEIRVLNEQNGVIGMAKKNGTNQYVYHKFTINPSKRPDIRGLFMYGNLPANDVSLHLIDENDQVLQITQTNHKGEFKFKQLRAGKSYRIAPDTAEKVPENASMMILDDMSGLMLPVSKLANGSFKFETLAPMDAEELPLMKEEDDTAVRFSFFAQIFNKLPMELPEGLEIYIVDDEGNIIAIAKTDRFGRFNYQKLPMDEEYLLRISEDDPNYALRIITADGKELGQLNRNKNGDFVYNTAAFSQKTSIAVASKAKTSEPITKEDVKKPKNNINNEVITPKHAATQSGDVMVIYYDFESLDITQASEKVISDLISRMKQDVSLILEINSYTDSWGEKDYNLWLSQQRSDTVKKSIVSRGISAERIKTRGYGENNLLNECTDGVKCPTEKHAENRRSELRLTY